MLILEIGELTAPLELRMSSFPSRRLNKLTPDIILGTLHLEIPNVDYSSKSAGSRIDEPFTRWQKHKPCPIYAQYTTEGKDGE